MDRYPPAQPSTSRWRDIIAVHPAAELFPPMSQDDLRALGEDIKAHGLQSPIVITVVKDGRESMNEPSSYQLLDGRNRLDAMELVGIPFQLKLWRRPRQKDWIWSLHCSLINPLVCGRAPVHVEIPDDPYDYVLSANVNRRHLTTEQKRDVIAKVIKAKPKLSNRQIAEKTRTSHPFVGKVRAELEESGDVETVSTSTDTLGREQPRVRDGRTGSPAPAGRAETVATEREMPESVAMPSVNAEAATITPLDGHDALIVFARFVLSRVIYVAAVMTAVRNRFPEDEPEFDALLKRAEAVR